MTDEQQKPEPQDVSSDEDETPASDPDYETYETPEKPPTIEPWTVDGAEDLPDEVKTTEITETEEGS